jgi:preprotein translocase subunit YajC
MPESLDFPVGTRAGCFPNSNMGRTMMQYLLAQQPPAEAPAGQQTNPMGGTSFLFIMAAIFLFFMMVIFPANRRQKKEQEKMIATLKRGTKVMTTGGIVGTIVSAKDGEDELVIRSEESRFRIKRQAVQAVLGSDEAEANKS